MPNTKSAKKALRQSLKRRERNLVRKKKMKETIKSFKKLIEAEKFEEAKNMVPALYKTLDKLAKVNFIKENKARRLKSRLTARLNNHLKQKSTKASS